MPKQVVTSSTSKTNDSEMDDKELQAYYRTSKKIIQEYSREIERYNRYRSARSYMSSNGSILDNRGALIDLYEACLQQDAHIKSVIETLESQVLGERYMLARMDKNGKYVKDFKETKKIQGTHFIKIITGIMESKLYGYTLLEIRDSVDPITGRLNGVNTIERRNVLPDQDYVVKRQGQFLPGWNIKSALYQDDYVLINNGDLGMFSATTPLILAKKYTFGNFISFAHTYGQPIIQGKSVDGSTTAKQNLADSIAKSAAQRIIVTDLEDELTVHALAMSNSEKIYTSPIDMINAEVSNLIVGSESMAGATQSYVGSTGAHQDIFRDRIEVYREFIENVMNEQIIPRLVKRGFISEGLEFRYSNRLEMDAANKVALYKVLIENFKIPPEEIEKEYGIIVEGQFKDEMFGADSGALREKKKAEASVNFLTGK